jgi:hypothetical protein
MVTGNARWEQRRWEREEYKRARREEEIGTKRRKGKHPDEGVRRKFIAVVKLLLFLVLCETVSWYFNVEGRHMMLYGAVAIAGFRKCLKMLRALHRTPLHVLIAFQPGAVLAVVLSPSKQETPEQKRARERQALDAKEIEDARAEKLKDKFERLKQLDQDEEDKKKRDKKKRKDARVGDKPESGKKTRAAKDGKDTKVDDKTRAEIEEEIRRSREQYKRDIEEAQKEQDIKKAEEETARVARIEELVTILAKAAEITGVDELATLIAEAQLNGVDTVEADKVLSGRVAAIERKGKIERLRKELRQAQSMKDVKRLNLLIADAQDLHEIKDIVVSCQKTYGDLMQQQSVREAAKRKDQERDQRAQQRLQHQQQGQQQHHNYHHKQQNQQHMQRQPAHGGLPPPRQKQQQPQPQQQQTNHQQHQANQQQQTQQHHHHHQTQQQQHQHQLPSQRQQSPQQPSSQKQQKQGMRLPPRGGQQQAQHQQGQAPQGQQQQGPQQQGQGPSSQLLPHHRIDRKTSGAAEASKRARERMTSAQAAAPGSVPRRAPDVAASPPAVKLGASSPISANSPISGSRSKSGSRRMMGVRRSQASFGANQRARAAAQNVSAAVASGTKVK